MSATVQKNLKKRKLEDISNTKSAAAQSLKAKLPTKSLVEVKMNDKKNDTKKITYQSKTLNKDRLSDKKANQDKKSTKKVLTNEQQVEIQEDQSEEINLTQSQVIIGNMFSLYALADKQPQKIKTIIDQIFSHNDNSEEFVVKTMFLYFLELMGLSEIATLQYNVQFIAKNTEEKKLLELFSENEKLDISFDKMIFFSQEKKALEQKKLLKRVCKIFVADVVDLLPDKASYLTSVVQRVCVFSKSQQRLMRYAFSYVGLYLYKFLLGQQSELFKLRRSYDDKQKNELKLKQKEEANKTLKRIESIDAAMTVIQSNIDTIQKHLILKRCMDTTPLIRKSVFEFFLQLDEKESQMAFNKDNVPLFDMIFNALKDEDSQIRKISLQMVSQVLTKMSSDQETIKMIEVNMQKHKLQIFKMAIPSDKHQDTAIIIKSLQVIQKMIEILPGIYNQEHIQMLVNLVHYQNQGVREEIGDLLLTLSDEFDDTNSLLELQKINPSKGVSETFVLNFNEEPNKSQKQILKLIKMFEKLVQTRSQYLTLNKKVEDTDEIQVPNMQKEEVQRIMQSDYEERALLMFQTFHRKTSVMFDVQSMCNIMKKEDTDKGIQHVLANLINTALVYCNTMRNLKDCPNLVFNKIWEAQTYFLKLTVMNELLQTFRVDYKILDPLLRAMITLSKSLEKDSQNDLNDELGKDLTLMLLKVIDKTVVDESQPETLQIIKNSILNLAQLQQHFPLITKELQELGLNFNDQLQHQVVPKLFNNEEKISTEALSFIHKFNILMSQISIKQIADSEYLKGMASFTIINYTQMILDNYKVVSQLTRSQLNTLIQVPFTFIDQLLADSQSTTQHIQFQTKMLHHLIDFYMELHSQYKTDENLQVVILKFIIECLILGGGENKISKGSIVIGLNDFPKVKEFINELIQNVSGRLKGNELVVQEQFQIILSLFMRDFNSLLSETGVEFLINFGTSKDPVVIKDIRKLYYSYKQRDRLLDTKKGIFYSFILKIVHTIYTSPDTKIYRLQDQAPGDIQKELVSLGLDALNPPFTLQIYSKLVFIQTFLKNFLNSIMLLIISNKTPSQQGANGLIKQQDEYAYFKMVEGIIRIALSDKANFTLLYSIKYFMHKNFLTQQQQEATLKGLKAYIEAQKENLNLKEDDMKVLDFIITQIQDKITQKKLVNKKNEESVNDKSVEKAIEAGEEQEETKDEIENKKVQDEEASIAKSMIGQKRKAQSSSVNKKDLSKKESETKKVKKLK